jgi:hypothetical protein
MGQTKEGGLKTSITMKARYGVDADGKSLLHKRIGALGGKKTMAEGAKPKGFALARTYPLDDPRHPKNAGAKGGKLSKRGRTTK